MLAKPTILAFVAALVAMPALAQNGNEKASTDNRAAAAKSDKRDTTTKGKSESTSSVSLYAPAIEIQHIRLNDQRGLDVFETPKSLNVADTGFKLNCGAAF